MKEGEAYFLKQIVLSNDRRNLLATVVEKEWEDFEI